MPACKNQRARSSARRQWAVVLAVCLTSAAAGAPPDEDLETLVRDGLVEALERRFPPPRTVDQLRMLALAQRNRAASLSDPQQRREAYRDADRRFEAWIDALRRSARDERQRAVDRATAQMIYADMILGGQVVPLLDELERTDLLRGDRQRATQLLVRARALCRDAEAALAPLLEELARSEARREKFLVLGLLDPLETLPDQLAYRLGWADVYLARYGGQGAPDDAGVLAEAVERFSRLTDADAPMLAARSRLGLALALSEQRRYADASAAFREVLRRRVPAALEAQCRYFWARNEILAGRFSQARTVLRPLVEAGATDKGGAVRFYRSLAEIWFARSRLFEAERLSRLAGAGGGDAVLRRRIRMLRQQGLLELHRLAQRGAAWRALVQLHVAQHIRFDAPPDDLAPVEVLFVAEHQLDAGRPERAAALLRAALKRPDLPQTLRTELLAALGQTEMRRGRYAEAAEAFEQLLELPLPDERGAQIALEAVQARLRLARQSRRPQDARRLAERIDRVLKRWPQHPQRSRLLWTRAVALWEAGDDAAAADAFARIPADSPHAAEAAFRRVMALRRGFERRRGRLDPEELHRQAERIAQQLLAFAQRAQRSGDATLAREHVAEALVSAAEVYVEGGPELAPAALNVLADFERQYPDSRLQARVLAVRIQAYLAAGDLDAALRRIDDYIRAAPPAQVGPLLARVADALLRRLPERREQADEAEARAAASAIPVFRRLRDWAAGKPDRRRYLGAATYALARALYIAGRYGQALRTVRALLADDSNNGPYLLLEARILTAQALGAPTTQRLTAARDAWARLLRDTSLRQNAPQRYYEARYHFLDLTLRLGDAARVVDAIRQERIWDAQLGGPAWKPRFEQLERRAARAAGRVEPRPATRPGP